MRNAHGRAWPALVRGALFLALAASQAAATDFYLYHNQSIPLKREPALVGVDLKPGVQRQAIQALQAPDGRGAVADVVFEMPAKGRVVYRLREAQNENAPIGAAMETLAAAPQVDRAYPVYRNPKTDLLVYVFDEIIVRLRPGVAERDIARYGLPRDLQIIERNVSEPGIFLLRVGRKGAPTLDAAAELAGSGLCLWAEPNFAGQIKKCAINDPYFNQQWHLNNTGQTGGVPNADVNAPEAWAVTTGSRQIVIGFSDDGIDPAHEDLVDNFFVNPGESGDGRETNGIDDDGNGYIDDWHGWDFFDNDNDPRHIMPTGESEGHGTAVAGIAAAVGNNGLGGAGIAYNCRILMTKIFRGDSYAGNYQTGNAIRYLARSADVLSNSWGGGTPSAAIDDAIEYAVLHGRGGRGCPVFVAAGNSSSSEVEYPARNNWTVAVGASDSSDRRFSYSSYGSRLTIMAPSGNFTTDRTGRGVGYDHGAPDTTGNYTGIFGGTSSATPLAAGIAALLLSVNPDLTAIEVQSILQASADKVNPSLAQYGLGGLSNQYGYGRLAADRALALAAGPQRVDDPFEDNDSASSAVMMESGFFSGMALLDDDWFVLTVDPYQDISAEAFFSHTLGNLDLALYRPDGSLAAATTGTMDIKPVDVNVGVTSGPWRMRVFSRDGAANYYHLAVNVRPPDDIFEPNDRIGDAADIGPGAYEDMRAYDPDFFRISVPAGYKLTTAIRFHNSLGDLDLYLLDTSGTVVSESATLQDTEAVTVKNNGAAANYYLWVDNYAGAQNRYRMYITLQPGNDDAFENNDTRQTAAALAPGHYGGLQPYDDDWYKTAVGPRHVLEAEIRFQNYVGDLDLEIFDASGALIDESLYTADNEFAVFANTGLTTTTAYVHVFPYTQAYPDYELILATHELTDDVFEPNDAQVEAKALPRGAWGDLVAMNPDYFTIEANQGLTIAAILGYETSLAPLKMSLYTPDGIPLASQTAAPPVLVARDAPSTGTYKLGVEFLEPGSGQLGLYGLAMFVYQARTATGEDAFEPNDNRGLKSTWIIPGAYTGLYCANYDFFRVPAKAGDSLYVAILLDNTVADLDLYLYDTWGQQIRGSAGRGPVELCTIDRAPETGDYFILVEPYIGAAPYDLLVGRASHAQWGPRLQAKRWNLYR